MVKKLSPRLLYVANCVTPGSIVADIGTDHAFVPIFLVENNLCEKVYACDINDGPLNRAKIYIGKYLSEEEKEKITVIKSDGLENVPKNCDTIIIAGMGGELISTILERDFGKRKATFILQPMMNSEKLREYLYNNGFTIIDENVVKEQSHRYYTTIIAKKGEENYSDIDIWVSKPLKNKKDETSRQYIEKLIKNQKKRLDGLRLSRFSEEKEIQKERELCLKMELLLKE